MSPGSFSLWRVAHCSSTSGHGPLSSWLASAPLSEISWAYLRASAAGLVVVGHGSVCLYLHQCHIVWILGTLQQALGLGGQSPPTLFLCSIVPAILVPLPFYINFRVIISVSMKTWRSHIRPLDLRVRGVHMYHMLHWSPENPSTHFIFPLAGPGSCFTFASLMAHTGISCCFAVSKLNISPNFAASLLSELPFSYPLLIF